MLAEMVGFETPVHGLLFDNATALYSIMAMDIWMAIGYYMLIFLAGLKSIPQELYEAAEISGAGKVRQFFSITVPLLKRKGNLKLLQWSILFMRQVLQQNLISGMHPRQHIYSSALLRCFQSYNLSY